VEPSLTTPASAETELLPVLPLKDLSLFPGASLTAVSGRVGVLKGLEIAGRCGRRVLALAQREASVSSVSPRDLYTLGTLARIAEDLDLQDGTRRVEVDGLSRARVVSLVGVDTMVAEVERLEEGDPGDEWGPAVEALARYLHSHPELRAFLDQQRRSSDSMSWVNLACQHLPITASARQKLLEASAPERCLKISKGLDALLRKEQST
jgi:ATP-dependent Lon protease